MRNGTYSNRCLAKKTRTCSYDSAGYGFSVLGKDLPRNMQNDVLDLHHLLRESGERRADMSTTDTRIFDTAWASIRILTALQRLRDWSFWMR